jgi:polysaccharide pyruvyl transferase WcaK-like protein
VSLSVCFLTNGPAARIGALLELLRPVADELVVAVDVDADAETRQVCAAFADVLIRVPFAPPLERSLAWLHAQCSARWILRLDSDEIPSAALLDALPSLSAAEDAAYCCFTRRWLYPDPARYLDQPPWQPDYQVRLVRNDPAFLAFPGETHTSAYLNGPARFLDLPLYHADCIVNSVEQRVRKARLYEGLRPGLRVAGRPLNASYLPEQWPKTKLAPVPKEDYELVSRVLSGQAESGRPRSQSAPRLALREEIDGLWEKRPVNRSAFDGRIAIDEPEHSMTAGELRWFDARVENLGAETWPWGARSPEIRLAHGWRTREGAQLGDEGRTPFPADVAPGEGARVYAPVTAPETPGRYTLHFDLVHEHAYRFGRGAVIDVQVERARRIAIVGGYGPVRHVGDDAIVSANLRQLAESAPEFEPVVLSENPETTTRRFGHRSGESVHPYLLNRVELDAHRIRDTVRLAFRTAALVRAARRIRRGRSPGRLYRNERPFLEQLRSAEVLLAVSGDSLTSIYSRRALWPQAATILAARALGIPVVVSGVTVGPFSGISDRLVASLAMRRASLITVRDRGTSAAVLKKLRVPSSRVSEAYDDTLSLEPAPDDEVVQAQRAIGIANPGPFFVVSGHGPADSALLQPLAHVVDHLAGAGIGTLFVPMYFGPETDVAFAEALRAQVSNPATFRILDPLPADDVVSAIIGRAAVAVGTRYHLAVFAAGAGVPAVGLYEDAYAQMKLEGLEEICDGGVRAVPATIAPQELVAAVESQRARGAGPCLTPDEPLAITRFISDYFGHPGSTKEE